ncbi:MAG: hypothetical protein ACI9OJ_001695, partial [Myxococcota bacterium]
MVLIGCPSDEPPDDETNPNDIIVTTDAQGDAGATSGTDIGSTDTTGVDTAETTAPGADVPTDAVVADAVVADDVATGCVVDADCGAFFEDLTDCEVAICEDSECVVDGAPNGSDCSDGDLCTKDDACVAGSCIGAAADCDDGNDCTFDECMVETGDCGHQPQTDTACDDSDPCTNPDVCSNGFCTTTAGECPSCATDSDCLEFATGDKCSGAPVCVNSACAVGTGPVDCSDIPTSACQVAQCVPQTGACVVKSFDDGAACQPVGACWSQGFCNGGTCNGIPKVCDDGNPCTSDACDQVAGCFSQPVSGGSCNDGSACTESDSCANGVCSGVLAVACNDQNPCTADACEPTTGACASIPQPGTCNDGDSCTKNDACYSGGCSGEPVTCNDGDNCTLDACTAGTCQNAPVDCDDGNPCTTDVCSQNDGCTSSTSGLGCVVASDCPASACSTFTCNDCGECVANAVVCDDGNLCTAGSCSEPGGCAFSPLNGSCDDGDSCTDDDVCSGGSCTGGVNICEVGTEDNPALSCLKIKQTQPNSPDGAYWLKPSINIESFQTWCDMGTLGGGWTRLANLAGETAVCSLATSIGAPGSLLDPSASTGVLGSAAANSVPMAFGQVLVVTQAGFHIFQSGDSEWNWSAVATGKINSTNVTEFGVQVALNGGG